MTWQDLIRDQIEQLENEKKKETKRLDKIRDDDSPNRFGQKVEIMANVKSISESITTLYIVLGRSSEVTI
jgi:phosphoenolpyruvate-protein kinase (PTS system EI component)